jgi:hypothetical protein
MRHMVSRRVAGLAIVAALVFAACDSGESPRPVAKRDPAPLGLRDGALRDGLRVAPNSRLAGAMFERPGQPGWWAILEIERDPIGVYDNYVAQAQRLGVQIPGSGRACGVGSTGLGCHGEALGGPSSSLVVVIELSWRADMRHIMLTVQHTNEKFPHPHVTAETRTAPLPPIVVRPAVHGGLPGMKFGAPNNALNRGNRFTLEPGSRLLADTPQYERVILQIDGNAEEVLGRYAAQLANPDPAHAIERKALPGGGTILEVSYGPESGGSALLTTDKTHRYLEIYYTGD